MKVRYLLAAGSALLGMCGSGLASAEQLRAGAARVSITPPADAFPFSAPREHDFVGVHDDVYARAIVIDDGTRRIAIVSLELTAVPQPEAIVAAIAEALKIPASAVIVTVTHTHNVPLVFFHGGDPSPAQVREIDRVKHAAVQAVRDAAAKLEPARVGFMRGHALVNVNNGEERQVAGWYDPSGSSDKALDVIRLVSAKGDPIALLVNYAMHGEVMFRSVTKNGGYEVTGDLPGAVSRILEGQPTGAPVVLYTPGAEADQLPLFKSLQPAATLPATDEGAAGWGILDLQARRLAAGVIDTLATMPAGASDAKIAVAAGALVCPGQKYDVERPSGKVLGVHDTAPVTIPLTTIRIGDIALAGVAADLSSDIGVAIKARSPLPQTTVITMLAGTAGYVLNDAAFRNPGHGALGSPVKPGCAPVGLPNTVAELLRQHR